MEIQEDSSPGPERVPLFPERICEERRETYFHRLHWGIKPEIGKYPCGLVSHVVYEPASVTADTIVPASHTRNKASSSGQDQLDCRLDALSKTQFDN